MSTPMETNTEELREILQTVYDLPMAGGGSSGADLVIGLDTSDTLEIDGRSDRLTFDSAAVVSAAEKLLSGETVSCVLNAYHHMHSGAPVRTSSPQILAYAYANTNNSAVATDMIVDFNLPYYYDAFWGTVRIEIQFFIKHNGTVSVDRLSATKFCQFSSAIV